MKNNKRTHKVSLENVKLEIQENGYDENWKTKSINRKS